MGDGAMKSWIVQVRGVLIKFLLGNIMGVKQSSAKLRERIGPEYLILDDLSATLTLESLQVWGLVCGRLYYLQLRAAMLVAFSYLFAANRWRHLPHWD